MCTNVYIYIYIYVNISVSILAQGQVVTPSAIPSTAILQRCRLSQVHNPRLRLLTEALEILRLLGDPKALCSDTVFFFGMMASSGSMASDEQIKKCCNEVRQRRIENAKREDEVIRTCGKHKKGKSDWCAHLDIERHVQEAILAHEADKDPLTDITRDRHEQE